MADGYHFYFHSSETVNQCTDLILSGRSDSEWTPSMNEVIKKSRRTSSVWRYCEILDDAFARCTLCEHKLSYKSSVTNLRKHFKKKHPDVIMEPSDRFTRNGLARRNSSDSDERSETQRATNSVTIDYLRPAGEENRPRHVMSGNKNSPIVQHTYSQSVKRECSPERHDFRQSSKYVRYSTREENEFELFGRSVTMQLKQLPLVQALELQAEITNLLVQKRIQSLRHSNEAGSEEQPMQYALVYATTAPHTQTEHTPEVTIEDKSSGTDETIVIGN